MATVLIPGFLKWDGTKYILDPDVEGSTGPTILNSSVGVLPDVVSDQNGVPAEIITFTGNSAITLTGVKDGVESRQLKVFNTSSSATLTIKHLNNTSLSGNQIICPGGADYILSFRESVMLIYSIHDSKWRVAAKETTTSGGSALPGGNNGQLQFNNNNTLGGITNWSTPGTNRIHIQYKLMTGGSSLEFNGTNQITRFFGSWLADGFAIGDVISIRGPWFDNNDTPQTPLNIVNTTITNVTSTVLTVAATISPAGYSLANNVFIQGGGFLSGGDSAGLLPDSGVIRIPTPTQSFIDTEIITARDSGGNTIPIISINDSVELMIGGTFDESNLATGVTNRRPATIAMWGSFHLDFTDERAWRDDKGFYTNFLNEFRARLQTTDATPTQLISKSVSSLQPYAFIELFVIASKSFPVDEGATWKFFGAKTSSGFDWQTPTYHTNTTGASSWDCDVTGDAIITVTGQSGTTINWRVYGRFI